jgi:type II secretory pathway pseudopilin PulG
MKSERGMSMVEATIILMVIGSLTAMLAPSVAGYMNDARNVAAKKDVEAIGAGILQMLKDTGSRCLRLEGQTECTFLNRVDLLVSAGNDPLSVIPADVTYPDSQAATNGSVNWRPDPEQPGQQDTMDDQLIENDNAGALGPYTATSFTGGGGPRMKLGWRGPYINGPINGDPWGTKYQANTIFLTVATDAFDTAGSPNQLQEGLRETGWNRDVIVLSAGVNRVVETSFGGTATPGVSAVGDDVIYVIGGSTR